MGLTFIASVGVCFLILATRNVHSDVSSDYFEGPQKIHHHNVPRIGGIALLCSIAILSFAEPKEQLLFNGQLFIIVLPVFFAGLLEDLTKNISPHIRLLAAILTGVLFLFLTDYRIDRTNIVFLDDLLAFGPLAAFLTMLSIATVVNGVNIVDGLNGLSLGTALLICAASSFIGLALDDSSLVSLSLGLIGALVGVLFFNFPFGYIFIGDGGAYLLGALLAMLAIAIPAELAAVSPFTSLLLVFYPLYELLRTIVRRIRNSEQVMEPDNAHLHSVLFRLFQKKRVVKEKYTNALSALSALSVPAFSCLWAAKFYTHTITLVLGVILSVTVYELLYFWACKSNKA